MSEQGLTCMESRQDKLMSCLSGSFPELFDADGRQQQSASSVSMVVFDEQNCGYAKSPFPNSYFPTFD